MVENETPRPQAAVKSAIEVAERKLKQLAKANTRLLNRRLINEEHVTELKIELKALYEEFVATL